jgi:hypothetical protein
MMTVAQLLESRSVFPPGPRGVVSVARSRLGAPAERTVLGNAQRREPFLLRDGPALLDTVYDRFSEAFETADLKSIKTILDALGLAP